MKERITGYEPCNGCGVCTLPCPIWQQSHDALLTFAGRARALQGGADIDELRESVGACLLCGSCEPVCSMGIKTVDITLKLRTALNGADTRVGKRGVPASSSDRSVLIPGNALRTQPELLERASLALSLPVAQDDGTDVIDSFMTGVAPEHERVNDFLISLRGLKSIVTPVGIMKRYGRTVFPDIEVLGLGESLIRTTSVQDFLSPSDLYVIDACSYNTDFHRCMPLYTGVSRRTGCAMNLDLQRVAIPTGSAYNPGTDATPKVTGQIRWILEGKNFDRIIVETVEDLETLSAHTNTLVLHVVELTGTK